MYQKGQNGRYLGATIFMLFWFIKQLYWIYISWFFSEKFETTRSFNVLELNMESHSTMYIQRGWLTHVYASLKPIIGSDDGLSPIEANAITGALLTGPWKECSVKL